MNKCCLTLLFAFLCSFATFAQDHIEQPVGPPAKTFMYDGNLEFGKIYLMPANPEKGFYWPYYLGTPKSFKDNVALFVQPNNDARPGAPFETHDYWASIIAEQSLIDYGNKLETFTLVPVFPRPKLENGSNLYTHALTRSVVENKTDSLRRIDLQLLAMIEDAQSKIRKNNYQIPDKFMLWGFSAAGDFVTRMALIHPERIQCLVAGGLGGFPILPIKSLEDSPLTYPVGVSDFDQLFNNPFNADAFKSIPMMFFQGGADENDSVAEGDELSNEEEFISDSYSYSQCILINNFFGTVPVDRVSKVSEIYSDFLMLNFDYVIVPKIDHRTEPFEDKVLEFLKTYSITK